MPDPHETILVRIADNGYGQDKFEYSGSFSDGWENSPSLTLRWRNDCSGDTAGRVYKFDQSDSSNANYRLGFSHTDDPYDDYSSYDKLEEASGVFYYGTPGQAGASTKVHVGIMFSGQATGYANGAPLIHAFADTSTSHDYGDNYFDFSDISGEECTSGNYGPPTTSSSATSSSATSSATSSSTTSSATSSSTTSSATSSSTGPTSSSATSSSSSSCNQSVEFTGQLNTLIAATDTTQSGIYGNFTTQSYSIATGVETGTFYLGTIRATGTSLSNALSDLTPLISHFNASGVRIDELAGTTRTTNINNNTTSYSSAFTGYNGTVYWQAVSGYVGKRFYVGYNPQISGNYTGANVAVTCPTTSMQVNFNRNRLIYNTTGVLALPENTITRFEDTVNSICTGFETTLTTSCLKFQNGEQKFGKVVFYENLKNAWTGDLTAGTYNLRYVSGSFTTSLGLHTLGSGTIKVDRYV